MALHSVFDIVLICVSLTNRNLLWLILILPCLHLDREMKKTDNIHQKKNCGSIKSLNYPALWFVYILMPGKEEWVLV